MKTSNRFQVEGASGNSGEGDALDVSALEEFPLAALHQVKKLHVGVALERPQEPLALGPQDALDVEDLNPRLGDVNGDGLAVVALAGLFGEGRNLDRGADAPHLVGGELEDDALGALLGVQD